MNQNATERLVQQLAQEKRLNEELRARLAAVEQDRDAASRRAGQAEVRLQAIEKWFPEAREMWDRFSAKLSAEADAARARIKARAAGWPDSP